MARFNFEISDVFQTQLNSLNNIDEVIPKMLGEVAPITENAVKNAIMTHKKTGDLIKSVKATKPKKYKNGGWYIQIGFKGYSIHKSKNKVFKVANAQKAMVLEFGSSKQTATPFLEKAKNDCNQQVIEKMQEVFNKELLI